MPNRRRRRRSEGHDRERSLSHFRCQLATSATERKERRDYEPEGRREAGRGEAGDIRAG